MEGSATALIPSPRLQKGFWPSPTLAQGGLKQQKQFVGNECDKRNGRDGRHLTGKVSRPRPAHKCNSDFSRFSKAQGVFNLNTQVPDSRLDLGVTQQYLHGPEVPSLLVD